MLKEVVEAKGPSGGGQQQSNTFGGHRWVSHLKMISALTPSASMAGAAGSETDGFDGWK